MDIAERLADAERTAQLRWMLERGRCVQCHDPLTIVLPRGCRGRRINQHTYVARTRAEKALEQAATRLLRLAGKAGA